MYGSAELQRLYLEHEQKSLEMNQPYFWMLYTRCYEQMSPPLPSPPARFLPPNFITIHASAFKWKWLPRKS